MMKSLRNAESCFDCEMWLSLVNCNYETHRKVMLQGRELEENI